MSYYQDTFDITIRGKKCNVTRMLNAAICNVGTGDIIVEGDSVKKIREYAFKDCIGLTEIHIKNPNLLRGTGNQ